MNKNCEVIEMIGSSQNANLLGVGEIRFHVVKGEVNPAFSLNSSTGGNIVSILTPGVVFKNEGFDGKTSQTLSNLGQRNIAVNGSCEISVMDKYTLSVIFDQTEGIEIDLFMLEYCQSLQRILLRGILGKSYGNISSFKNCPALTQLSILSPKVDGDVAELPNNPFISIVFSGNTDAEHANVYGNISSFSRYTTLTTLDVRNTQVSGSLNSMLDAMYNSGNGRTSGTLTIKAQGSNVLYNGEAITNQMVATFSSSGWSIA